MKTLIATSLKTLLDNGGSAFHLVAPRNLALSIAGRNQASESMGFTMPRKNKVGTTSQLNKRDSHVSVAFECDEAAAFCSRYSGHSVTSEGFLQAYMSGEGPRGTIEGNAIAFRERDLIAWIASWSALGTPRNLDSQNQQVTPVGSVPHEVELLAWRLSGAIGDLKL